VVSGGKIAQIEHQMMLQHNTHHLISSSRRMEQRDHIGFLKEGEGDELAVKGIKLQSMCVCMNAR
jgi:hypothetical protein